MKIRAISKKLVDDAVSGFYATRNTNVFWGFMDLNLASQILKGSILNISYEIIIRSGCLDLIVFLLRVLTDDMFVWSQ